YTKIGCGSARNITPTYSFSERDKNWMPGMTCVARTQFLFPFVQKLERCRRVVRLIAQIVRDPAICVHVAKMLTQAAGQKPGRHRKVFVMAARQTPAVFSGFRQRGRMFRNGVFAG